MNNKKKGVRTVIFQFSNPSLAVRRTFESSCLVHYIPITSHISAPSFSTLIPIILDMLKYRQTRAATIASKNLPFSLLHNIAATACAAQPSCRSRL